MTGRVALAFARALVSLLAVGLGGCAMDVAPVEPGPRDPFIALASDFDGFAAWSRTEIPDIGTMTGHAPGTPRVIYVNAPIPPLGEPFAVGTILVKTLEAGAPSAWEVHAMVKRGGDFAPAAGGWEWFDLALDDAQVVAIGWRGEGSARDPGGYLASDGGVVPCAECHGVVGTSADYVFTRSALE